MNSWKIILATVVIFAAGVLTGGFLVNDIDHQHRPHRPPENSRPPEPHPLPEPPLVTRMNKQFMQQLDEKLKLSPEQREKIAKIIAEGQERNHELWTNVAPKIRSVMMDVNRQIREQLSPEQRKDFEELLKQFHAPHRPQGTNGPGAATNSVSMTATNKP
ncbi:MAG TPA: hypothetical protein VFV23_05920 [Verrucomicrobiae bacterium]|nr:hypothetical protein [Verrucomicrobiae bacterium]